MSAINTIRNASGIRQSAIGGGLVFLMTILVAFVISGVYSDVQAKQFVESMAPSLRTLCFATITAAATITSLILTTVGFTQRSDNEFDDHFFYRVKAIAFSCAAVLILAVIVLLVLTVPITESEALEAWFTTIYYGLIVCSGLISALIVAIIILLYITITDVIHIVGPMDV